MEIEENVRARELSGVLQTLGRLLLIAIPLSGMFFLLNVPQYLGWLVFNEQYMGLFLGLALAATYLLIPAKPSRGRAGIPWYDVLAHRRMAGTLSRLLSGQQFLGSPASVFSAASRFCCWPKHRAGWSAGRW
jgi:TRAP-type uncharacterized transport system fused permease subunit